MAASFAGDCDPASSSPPLVSVRGLCVRFGGIVALDDVSFDVPEHAIVGLIGPNGAGKTTLFNCLSRLYRPSSGDILLQGRSICRTPAHRMAQLGIGRTFQNLALFRGLTVRDNLRVGAHSRARGNVLGDMLRLPGVRRREARTTSFCEGLLQRLDLRAVAHLRVSDLPFGTQKRVELGRALAAEPRLLLLDEPACGLNHEEVQALKELILRLREDFRLTVLLVEHHMNLVMGVSDQVVALNFGRKLADGRPQAVRDHPDVLAAYLGAAS